MMRKRFVFLGVLALVFALFPSVAFALDIWPNGSYWAGVPYDEPGYYAAFVRADNRYDAAVYGLGLDPASLSAATKLKLSDPSYGGNFYKYAMTFENVSGWDDMPEWLPAYVMMGTIGLGQSFERIYASKTTSAFRTSALADYEKVVSGEDLGGGGSGENISDYFDVVVNCCNIAINDSNQVRSFTCKRATVDSSGNVTLGSGTVKYSAFVSSPDYISSAHLYVSPAWQSFASQYISQGKKVIVGASPYTPTNPAALVIIVCDSYTVSRHENPSSPGSTRDFLVLVNGSRHVSRGNAMYADGVGPFFVVPSSSNPVLTPVDVETTLDYWGEFSPVLSPDGDWPEPTTPVTPDPPEVPTPTAPTETADPDPTAPTITWPTAPTLVLPTSPIVSTTPEGIDYTALLTLINDNLNSIDAYLQNFYTSFNSFRSDFLSGIDDIVDGLRNIYQYLGHLNNILEVHCKHITDQIEESVYNLELYIKRLFEWLPRQLDFDAQYDDSAVTALLRRILYKIPGGSTGPVTYKPNPQSDEPSFWDWLADLFNRILQKLLDLLPDEMIQLGQLFGELINLFPFSIPWDLFALLALFGHEPVTPVIDIPWGFGGSSGQVIMVRIDLHAWDGVAEMVRPVFLVLFCLQLALLSRDLLKIINVKSGGE